MKWKQACLSVAVLFFSSLVQHAVTGEDAPVTGVKRAVLPEKISPKPAVLQVKSNDKSEQTPITSPVGKNSDDEADPVKPSTDEEAIRLTGETYVKAFCNADAKSVAAHFTSDAEYVDEDGTIYQGREAIEGAMTALFKQNKDWEVSIDIDSIRFISPGVAIEDGTTTFTTSDEDEFDVVLCGYTAIHVKSNGKWLTASVREQALKNRRQHRTKLEQLSWLQGDWVDEGDDMLVFFSCKTTDGGNFLLREFKIHIAGQEAMNGTQRIGWDPLTGKLKSWVFDSEGGYSEGFWHRDDERWVLKSCGVTADGEPASSTTIYTLVNDDTMTWQSVDHEIGGVELPDSDPVTIVRRAPAPLTADDTLTLKSE